MSNEAPKKAVATEADARRMRATPYRRRLSTANHAAAPSSTAKKLKTANSVPTWRSTSSPSAVAAGGSRTTDSQAATTPSSAIHMTVVRTGRIWAMSRSTRNGWANSSPMRIGRKTGASVGASELRNVSANSAAMDPKTATTDSSSGPRFRRYWNTLTPNSTKNASCSAVVIGSKPGASLWYGPWRPAPPGPRSHHRRKSVPANNTDITTRRVEMALPWPPGNGFPSDPLVGWPHVPKHPNPPPPARSRNHR